MHREPPPDDDEGVRYDLVIGRLDGEDLRFLGRVFWHDDEGRRPLAFDVELDATEVLDENVEDDAVLIGGDQQPPVGDDHQTLADIRLDMNLLIRCKRPKGGVIIHRNVSPLRRMPASMVCRTGHAAGATRTRAVVIRSAYSDIDGATVIAKILGRIDVSYKGCA